MGDTDEYIPLDDGSVLQYEIKGAVCIPDAPHDIIAAGVMGVPAKVKQDVQALDARTARLTRFFKDQVINENRDAHAEPSVRHPLYGHNDDIALEVVDGLTSRT